MRSSQLGGLALVVVFMLLCTKSLWTSGPAKSQQEVRQAAFIGQSVLGSIRLVSNPVSVQTAGPTPPLVLPERRAEVRMAAAPATIPMRCKIPHIIHQSWRTTKVPQIFTPYTTSWLRVHPDFTYYYWSDEDIQRLVEQDFPQFAPMFRQYKHGIMRADAFRYLVLYKMGGVYVDMDFEALRPLYPLLNNHQVILGREPHIHAHLLNDRDVLLCNAFLASCPGHPFWRTVFVELDKRKTMSVMEATGPLMLTAALETYQADAATANQFPIHIPEPVVLFPKFDPYTGDMRAICVRPEEKLSTRQRNACATLERLHYTNQPPPPESLAVHHWTHIWHGNRMEAYGRALVDIQELVPSVKRPFS